MPSPNRTKVVSYIESLPSRAERAYGRAVLRRLTEGVEEPTPRDVRWTRAVTIEATVRSELALINR